jgi:PAS domain-containing protein
MSTEGNRPVKALTSSDQELRLLVETIPALVWRAGPEGNIEYVNKRVLEYLGKLALLSNFGPVVLMDFGPPPGPSTLRSPRLDRGTSRGLESQNGFVRATSSGA